MGSLPRYAVTVCANGQLDTVDHASVHHSLEAELDEPQMRRVRDL